MDSNWMIPETELDGNFIGMFFNQLPKPIRIFLNYTSNLGSLGQQFTLFSMIVIEIVILYCRLAWNYLFSRPDKTKLRLRGLPNNAEPDQSIEYGDQYGDHPRHISRLEWRNQMNRFMEMLPSENKEVIDRVVNHIQVLLSHHQMDQPEVEKDLVRVIYDKAVGDPANSHLYVRLCQKLTESQIDWSLDFNFIGRLFQLVVDEFNRPHVLVLRTWLLELWDIDPLRSNKTNIVKLMAAIFKRKIPRVPDEWITDCINCLIQRQAANLDNSTQELCLFLKTILISESDHECNNLLPSQQNLLLPCIEALQRAILNRKLTTEEILESSDSSSSESETDSESETESEPEIKTDIRKKKVANRKE
ncbi:hypothetical protein DAPPUDRAFT_319590 [Daphnia pulex]|uniref:MIF4G domain-containing protein n=1 Tax=Daphnia pulex TaxID=6669 RepID=E9GM78_DAPPU|nr:hypothetical protein DAPPUDRAFT_319590 [Daphnia pulex]|eukprot:EFX79315.1 hypothetical protein DAPPUDRAFT_319590 [Daphnia pulex]